MAVLLLLIHWLLLLPLLVGFLFYNAVLSVHFLQLSSLDEEERAGCFALLSIGCLVTVNVLWLFLMVLWVGLKCVIEVFPDHTYLLFYY